MLAAALSAFTLLASPCLAQTAPSYAANHPDWIGYYRNSHADELQGFKPSFTDDKLLDVEIEKHLQPWAKVKMEQTNGVAEDTGAICQLDGPFRLVIRGGSFQWLPTLDGKKILLVSGGIYSAGVRKVYMDRPHPKYPPPTWLGDSIGRWEGDTLVVDTVGFNSKFWLTSSMQPHTEELHSIERYRMAAKGLIEVETTIEDRQALTSPYKYTMYFTKVDSEVGEHVCNPEEGDMRMWNDYRVKGIKAGMIPVSPK